MISEGKLMFKGLEVGSYRGMDEPRENLLIFSVADERVSVYINLGFVNGYNDDIFRVVQLNRIDNRDGTVILETDETRTFAKTDGLFDLIKNLADSNNANLIESDYHPQEVFNTHQVEYLEHTLTLA